MATVIATVESIEGKFFAKDLDGNTVELNRGDSITEGMVVFGDSTNPTSASIDIAREDGGDNILLLANDEQTFDESLFEDSNIEDALASESMEDMLSSESSLDEEIYSDEVDSDEEEGSEEDETEAGDEKKKQDESSAEFAARDGNAVDVNSDLRDAAFKFKSHTYEHEDKFETEALDRLTTIESKPNIPTTPPPTPSTPPTTKPPVTIQTVTPEVSIDDVTIDEVNGFMIFTVTASSAAGSEISFTYNSVDGTAKNVIDYEAVTGVGTIKAGEDSTTIKVPIVDDFYAEETESFRVVLSDISPNATIADGIGRGTILDNGIPDTSTPSEPNNPDSSDGYGSEDTVYVKLTDDSSVNEGSDLVHGIKLVDADGNDVLLLDGQSV
ncbi:MAG: Calx-beta domain-containing protein, partial [Campylobacterota bacterium]|nr:Calx-beta domain-containing protein [Campylobacterota bacterium]